MLGSFIQSLILVALGWFLAGFVITWVLGQSFKTSINTGLMSLIAALMFVATFILPNQILDRLFSEGLKRR